MGRALHKKYFGNRNIGSAGVTTDDGIGGSGLGVYTLAVQKGSIEVDSNSGQPTLLILPPTFPNGVQATATVVWEVASITINPSFNGAGYTDGETVYFSGAGDLSATITVVSDNITSFTPVERGDYTTIPSSEDFLVIGETSGASNARSEIRWRVKSITTVEPGSGYAGPVPLSWQAGEAGPISGTPPGAPTVAYLTDTGAVGSATNQENAILMTADIGNGPETVDIIKQVSTRRYKVKNANNDIGIVKLIADSITEPGQANIRAFPTTALTEYYVTKLTAHYATLTAKTGPDFPLDGKQVPWSFDAASSDIVQIENG